MGSKSPKTQTTTAQPWEPQGEQLQQLFDAANAFFQSGGPQTYGGPRVAGEDPNTVAAREQLVTNAGSLDTQAAAAQQANQSLFNASDVGNNPIVSRAIQAALNPLGEQFTRKVLPALRVGEMGSGTSSRQGVLEANATNDFNRQSSNLVGQLMGQFYGQGLDAQTKALSLSPALAGLTNAGAKNLAIAGESGQAFEQAQLDARIQEFLERQNAPLQNLANFKNLITGGYGGTTTAPTGTQDPSFIGGLIGGGLTGYAATGNPTGAVLGGLASFL